MTTPIYDFTALTPAQLRVLGAISINQDGGHSSRTLVALVKLGMIERYEERRGAFVTYRYFMPLAAHMAWCAWCSETVTDEEMSK